MNECLLRGLEERGQGRLSKCGCILYTDQEIIPKRVIQVVFMILEAGPVLTHKKPPQLS